MQKAVAPDISTWPEPEFRLIASRCDQCGDVAFPVQPICARCSHEGTTPVHLPRRGQVVAWTTQNFVPSYPYIGREDAADFVPFGVALVQFGDLVRVEGRLTVSDPNEIRTGMQVELTMVPFADDDEGNEILTYAFQPV
jgi:uncharacterized OB-fold protein